MHGSAVSSAAPARGSIHHQTATAEWMRGPRRAGELVTERAGERVSRGAIHGGVGDRRATRELAIVDVDAVIERAAACSTESATIDTSARVAPSRIASTYAGRSGGTTGEKRPVELTGKTAPGEGHRDTTNGSVSRETLRSSCRWMNGARERTSRHCLRGVTPGASSGCGTLM